MGRTLPEDVPIESKTVAKAIERAQNTVEARNAEMRKDNLKYDEVMDQQRKVIYERRLQIIDGDDLEEHTEDLLAGAAEKLVAEHCPTEFEEDWDLKALIDGLTQYYPTKFAVEDLAQAATTEDLVESIVEEALDYYEKHAESMPGGAETMRQIERDVYLQIIDARWRDHLAEMDNLKDGIHLRWTVQADPLNAWQQEGYSMFGQLMEVIDNDYLRYILHVEAVQAAGGRARPRPGGLRRRGGPGGRDGRAGRRPRWPSGGPRCPAQTAVLTPPTAGTAAAAEPGPRRRSSSPNAPDPDALVPIVKAAAREGRAQRPLLVRERQEVQVLPWRRLTGRRPRHPATSQPSSRRWGSGWPRPSATWGATSSRPGGPSSRPRWPSPTCGTTPTTRGRSPRSWAGCRPISSSSTALRGELEDARALLRADRGVRGRGGTATSRSTPSWWRRSTPSGRGSGALELQSLFSGEYDELDAVCEVHAGAGGTDAQDWTEMLLRMYQRWAERRGFTVEVDEATEGQEAGPALGHLHRARSLRLRAAGHRARRAPAGPHVALRLADTGARPASPPWTSPPSSRTCPREVEIDEKDLRIDTYRSSGAGGQHVNKTDSAVRLTHLPTGIVVSCQNERSQHQNKAKAMQILGAKLADRARTERQAELDALSGDRVDNAWGNQIRSYVMAPYQLVKDLRTGYETGNVDAVLDGDLDAFMEAELRRQRGERVELIRARYHGAPCGRDRRGRAVTCTGAGDPIPSRGETRIVRVPPASIGATLSRR